MVSTGPIWFRTYPLDSWDDFKELISEWLARGPEGVPIDRLWFRGQGDASYRLVASLDRNLSRLDVADRSKVQDFMLETFRDRAAVELRQDHDRAEMLGILQHHGAPTRLLDWSTSPYVAAFFAVSSSSAASTVDLDDIACAVWAINSQAKFWGAEAGLKQVRISYGENRRALNQRGFFSQNTSLETSIEDFLERYYQHTSAHPEASLFKIEFPRSEVSRALKDLELMGLTSESLFPGLEGLSRYSYLRALDLAGTL